MEMTVVSVSRAGCRVACGDGVVSLTWGQLHDAAGQDTYGSPDAVTCALADAYRQILSEASAMVRGDKSLPITGAVQQDETRVWWVATFADVTGEWRWIPRHADEGGTMATREAAEYEADRRAARLRRLGYTVQML